MPRLSPKLAKPNAGLILIFGASAAGGFAYRHFTTSSSPSTPSLNPHTFTPFTLISKQPVSSTSSIFTLRHTTAGEPSQHQHDRLKEVWRKGVWSVQIKQPQLQIARAYTPLPPADDDEEENVRLLIRREEKGEVSGYLHALPERATVELRGPKTELEIPGDVREVLFLAGGTGIAPAMQVAYALARRKEGARMHVLWANRRREDCFGGRSDTVPEKPRVSRLSGWRSLFGLEEEVVTGNGNGNGNGMDVDERPGVVVGELEHLKGRFGRGADGALGVDYFVDEEGSFIKPKDVLRQIQWPSEVGQKANTGRKLILVSGPEGFIKYWAGPKVWADGGEVQGPLGGVLSQLDLKGWTVWKL